MLSADKDLLLAKLNQDLLALHLLELNTVLNRFQNTIGASSLLGGFAYAAIIQAELDIGWRGNPDQLVSEAVFFLAASITLSLAMFAMSVSTYASILGYRVSVQSAQQNSIMKATKMLLRFYTWVLVAGVLAMFTIIIAAMAIVFFKAEKTVRWPSTVIFLVAIPAIFFTLLGLNRDMNKIAKLNESSRVAMGGDDGGKVSLNEDTLGVGRMARNVLSETYARGQRPIKGIAAVMNHLGSKEAAEQDSDPLEPALLRRSATWTGPTGP
mmetsp:Transcript_13178/g.31065  ORF Transcript_13178/g.31065 Transcript_13178/m.31065 type:complete len:268 (-) Transcript_13178:91-894(-)